MGAGEQSRIELGPMFERTAADPEAAGAGGGTLGDVLVSTESEVAAIMRRAEQEVARLDSEAEERLHRQMAQRREQLAELRWELTERASLLASRFEAMLDLLDAAEIQLGGEPPTPRVDGDERMDAIRMTLRERRRVSFAHEPATHGDPAAIAAAEAAGEQLEQAPTPKRRWWHRWLREAA
jgi:hypothetical protein